MSYILDALRRANSERERGSVPTLHANPGPADLAADDDEEIEHRGPARAGTGSRPTWPLAAGAALVAAALAAFMFWPRTPEPVLASAPEPRPAPQPVVQPTPQAPPATVATVPLSVPPLESQAPPPPVPAPVQALPPAAVAAAPAPQRIPTQAELPEALRRQLPQLTTGGAMYSDAPANRMLILNGQVLHEGEKLSPDLVLEEIGLKTAVLVFKGQRFTISY